MHKAPTRVGKRRVIHRRGSSQGLLDGTGRFLHRLFSLEPQAGDQLGATEMVDDAVKDVGKEKGDKRHFLLPKDKAPRDDNDHKRPKTRLRLPVDILEAWITNRADHQPGDQQ